MPMMRVARSDSGLMTRRSRNLFLPLRLLKTNAKPPLKVQGSVGRVTARVEHIALRNLSRERPRSRVTLRNHPHLTHDVTSHHRSHGMRRSLARTIRLPLENSRSSG